MLEYLYGNIYQYIYIYIYIYIYTPMKMEEAECSETSPYKFQTPENYPEESTQHSEQVKSLKSRISGILQRTHF